MNNLLQAIMTKLSGSSLSSYVGNRIYLDVAPDGAEFPYVVFFIVSGTQDKTFTEHYTNTLIQFSLFSASTGATEITTMYGYLKTALDECALTITGSALVWMRESNLITTMEDVLVADATVRVKHWSVDFEILTSLN
jgi:hypothetical protein